MTYYLAGLALACLTLLLLLAKWRREIDRALTGPTRDGGE